MEEREKAEAEESEKAEMEEAEKREKAEMEEMEERERREQEEAEEAEPAAVAPSEPKRPGLVLATPALKKLKTEEADGTAEADDDDDGEPLKPLKIPLAPAWPKAAAAKREIEEATPSDLPPEKKAKTASPVVEEVKVQTEEKVAAPASVEDLQAELERLRQENASLKTFPVKPAPDLQEQLDRLQRENEELKEIEESDVSSEGEREIEPATKGQIKRMNKEAAEVLQRPIAEGFGFKMLQKMGWKEGEGLGKQDNQGIATPLWMDSNEGKAGIFAAKEGEQRPRKLDVEEEERFNVSHVPMFIPAGGSVPEKPVEVVALPPPTVENVTPALLNLLMRRGSGGAPLLDVPTVTSLLNESLTGDAGEQFLRLVDDRLGQRMASGIAKMRQSAPKGPWKKDEVLQPLWQLTKHHVPGAGDD